MFTFSIGYVVNGYVRTVVVDGRTQAECLELAGYVWDSLYKVFPMMMLAPRP